MSDESVKALAVSALQRALAAIEGDVVDVVSVVAGAHEKGVALTLVWALPAAAPAPPAPVRLTTKTPCPTCGGRLEDMVDVLTCCGCSAEFPID